MGKERYGKKAMCTQGRDPSQAIIKRADGYEPCRERARQQHVTFRAL